MAANKQIILMQTILAGVATFAMLALFHTAQPDDMKTVGAEASMHLVDRATDLPNLVGAGGLATDGDDDEAQLAQQQMQQAEQQAEEQEQLANQEAQQAEQQGLQVEQQATLSVPGS
jgi:hypothetical protein